MPAAHPHLEHGVIERLADTALADHAGDEIDHAEARQRGIQRPERRAQFARAAHRQAVFAAGDVVELGHQAEKGERHRQGHQREEDRFHPQRQQTEQ